VKNDILRKFRCIDGAPLIALPNQRRLFGGRDLNGAIWIQIEGCPRITMPPKQAVEFAIGLLSAGGVQLEECDVDNLLK